MARYMLEAPDDLMVQAKSAAAREGVSFAEWLRRAALSRLGGLAEPEATRGRVDTHTASPGSASPFVPSKPVKCELRNPAVPSQKCALELGHAGDHVFA